MLAIGVFDTNAWAERDLANDLCQIGRGAQIVSAAIFPGVGKSTSVAIHGSPIAGATMQLGGGFVGPSQLRGSHALRVGGLVLKQRSVLPMEAHYLVYPRASWSPSAAPIEAFAARLVQKNQGIFERRRASLTWVGGPFAALLDSNRELHDTLWKFLQLHDRLEIRAQPNARLVRIVHKRAKVIESDLFTMQPARCSTIEQPLFAAFEWIASSVHAWATPA